MTVLIYQNAEIIDEQIEQLHFLNRPTKDKSNITQIEPISTRSSDWNKDSETDFLNKLITSIKIRNGMDEGTLQSHIAFSAGQPKKPAVMTGARTVMDILRASEMIREQDGKIILAKIEDDKESEKLKNTESDFPQATRHYSIVSSPQVSKLVNEKHSSDNPHIKININVTVNCSTADLDSLGEKLNRIIKDVNRKVLEDEETDINE